LSGHSSNFQKNKIRQNERKEKERKKEKQSKAKEMGYMRDSKAFTLPRKRNP